MTWDHWVSTALLVVGVFVGLSGSLGVLRMPDFYTRLHPAGKTDSLAQALIILGLAVLVIPSFASNWGLAIKLVLLTSLLFVTAPTSTHAISKAALLDPRMPRHWTHPEDASAHDRPSAGATDEEATEEDRSALASEDDRGGDGAGSGRDRASRDVSSRGDRGRHPDWSEQVDEKEDRDE